MNGAAPIAEIHGSDCSRAVSSSAVAITHGDPRVEFTLPISTKLRLYEWRDLGLQAVDISIAGLILLQVTL